MSFGMDNQPTADTIEPFLADAVPTLESESRGGDHYLPPAHIQLLEQLEHLSRYSHFIQVVTGVAGSGKTTLLELFYPDPDDSSVHACCIAAQPEMAAEALLSEISQQLNLDVSASASLGQLQQALLEHVELLKQLSRQLLIVIDDAEHLSIEALDLLFNQLANRPDEDQQPSLVLFAAPSIAQRLQHPQLAEVVSSHCHFSEVNPFSSDECFALLEHSYTEVNRRLNDTQRQQLYAASLGLPGRLPRALESVLKGEQPQDSEPVQAISQPSASQTKLWPWLSLTALILVATGAWFSWPLLQSQLLPEQHADSTNRVRLQLDLTNPPAAGPAANGQPSELEQRLAQARAALEAEQASAPSETPDNSQRLETASTKPPLERAPASEPAVSNNKLALNLPLPGADSHQPGTAAAAAATAAQVRYYGDGQSLLQWNPNGYTLQMLGARQESSVIKFIAAMPERDKLRYFATIYKGKPWYVVVYQQFPNRDAAMIAIGELPPELRARRPWARSIQGIQDDIRRAAE
jgi:DamX protein